MSPLPNPPPKKQKQNNLRSDFKCISWISMPRSDKSFALRIALFFKSRLLACGSSLTVKSKIRFWETLYELLANILEHDLRGRYTVKQILTYKYYSIISLILVTEIKL